MKNGLIFFLTCPSKIIVFEKYYKAFDTVFHHQMKHLEVRQEYSAGSSGDETVRLMLDKGFA